MAPKSVTIKLTDKQRKQIRDLTGSDHAEVRFDAVEGTKGAARADISKKPLSRKTPLSDKTSFGSNTPGFQGIK